MSEAYAALLRCNASEASAALGQCHRAAVPWWLMGLATGALEGFLLGTSWRRWARRALVLQVAVNLAFWVCTSPRRGTPPTRTVVGA